MHRDRDRDRPSGSLTGDPARMEAASVDRSADQPDQPTASWPSITDYWPDVSAAPGGSPDPTTPASPARPSLAPAGPTAKPERDGITWIGRPGAEANTGRRRWRVALGGMLAATLLVVTGGVLASLIKQAHETTTTAEQVTSPPAARAVAAPPGPTGAATVVPASSPVTPSSPAPPRAATVLPPAVLPAAATFELAAGSPSVTLRTRDLGTQLYQVAVADGATGDPVISDNGSVHRLTVTHNGKGVLVPLAIALNSKVRWTVRVTGGISQNVLNFRDSDLIAIELAEGASKTELTLPPAAGTLPVRVTHGVHTLQVNLAGDDPVRAQIRAGAGKVVLLGDVTSGVAKGAVLTGPGFSAATDRIDVIATAGIGTLTVTGE
jgi:hypothetical protein